MAKKRTRRTGRTVKATSRQTGTRKSVKADRRKKALAPGRRVSRTGRRYTETRKNRSDKRGSSI